MKPIEDFVNSKKKEVIKEAEKRSRLNPDNVHYVFLGDVISYVTDNEEQALKYNAMGLKLYCKYLDGNLIL